MAQIMPTAIAPGRPFAPSVPQAVVVLACGGLAIWIAYAIVFLLTTDMGLFRALIGAGTNALPLLLLAIAAARLLQRTIFGLPARWQVLAHVALAPSFALGWYGSVLLLQALDRLVSTGRFAIIGWDGPALPWQTFQGLLIYALVVAVSYAATPAKETDAPAAGEPNELRRYLIRTDEGLVPIDVADIVSIVGAQDYADVVTASGRHLARVSLVDLEQRLDGRTFLRVHRSAIINLHWVERVEPAGGGRMTAIMRRGDPVAVSRAGARLLRSLAV